MAQIAQGGCGISTLGDNQKLSGPGQSAPGGPAWAEGVGSDDLHTCLTTSTGLWCSEKETSSLIKCPQTLGT